MVSRRDLSDKELIELVKERNLHHEAESILKNISSYIHKQMNRIEAGEVDFNETCSDCMHYAYNDILGKIENGADEVKNDNLSIAEYLENLPDNHKDIKEIRYSTAEFSVHYNPEPTTQLGRTVEKFVIEIYDKETNAIFELDLKNLSVISSDLKSALDKLLPSLESNE